jgi:chaperonin GroES
MVGAAKGIKLMIKPLRDGVLFKPEITKQIGSIIIPDTAQKERLARGVVVKVGPGKFNDRGVFIPTTIEPGMRILYREHKASEVEKIDGVDHRFVAEMDILGEVVE